MGKSPMNHPPKAPPLFDFRRWRTEMGLTQDEAGRLLGISGRQVQKYEAGTVAPDLRTQLACRHLARHGAAEAQKAQAALADWDLKTWRKGRAWTLVETAAALGTSYRQLINIEGRKTPVDPRTYLACKAIEEEQGGDEEPTN